MVKDGRFREDCSIAWRWCPSRYRPCARAATTSPPWQNTFRCEVNAREGRDVPGFQPEVIDRLYAHEWPGNVRELENLVQRLVIVAGNREVVLEVCRRTCGWTWSTSIG